MLAMGVDKVIVVLTRPIEYRKKKTNSKLANFYYHKYPEFVKTIQNRYQMYNQEVEKVIELEKEKKIFVIRPSRLVEIKRIEKDHQKIQEMYDLGVEDTKRNLENLKKYLKN